MFFENFLCFIVNLSTPSVYIRQMHKKIPRACGGEMLFGYVAVGAVDGGVSQAVITDLFNMN